MRTTRRQSALAICLSAVLVVMGANSPRAADPYEINVVLPLTGGSAFLGKAEQQTVQQLEKLLAQEGSTIHGRPVRFVFHDDQSNPQTAVQLATQITRSTPAPAIVLGSAVVAMCNAMAPLMRRGPVLYCFSPGIYPQPGSFVFSTSVATRDLASSLLRYFRLRGWTNIGLITSTDASGQDALKHIKELVAIPENKDLKLVAEASFNPSDVSAAAQIQRIKGQQPQALIAWTTGAPVGTVFKAITDAGLDVPVATTNGNMTYAQMAQYASFLPKELYIPSSPWPADEKIKLPPEVEAAKQRFFKAFEGTDVQPDSPSALAWDPSVISIAALKDLPPNATAEQVRTYIGTHKGFVGINGIYDFEKHPQRGLDESNVVITRWNPSKKVWDVVSEPRGIPIQQ